MLGRKVKTSRANSHKKPEATRERTIKGIRKELDAIRSRAKNARKGYQQEVHGLMVDALSVALVLRSNEKLTRKFLRHVKSERNTGGVPINIVTEVMVYVAGATSQSGRKIAWKRGRVIEFLHDQGIKIGKIASEIKLRGGVEAVLKQAITEDPRREKVPADAKTSAKNSKPLLVKARNKQDQDTFDSDKSDVTPARSAGGSRRNDGQVIMSVLINLSDRDMLFELPVKSRVKIYATRSSQKRAKIEVSKVKKLKSEVREEKDGDRD